MEWHQLEYFKTVAVTQNFTQAAKVLSISQSALSRSIAKLEGEIGFSLFERSGKTIKLNSYGQIFLQYVESSMQKIEDGKQVIQDMIQLSEGQVSFAFLLSLGTNLVPNLLSTFRSQNPNIKFKLYQNYTTVLLDQLESGEIDLCLCSPAFVTEGIEWYPLFDEELFVAVPATHRLAKRRSIQLSEMAGDSIVTFRKDYGLRVLTDRYCQEAGIQPHIAFEGAEIFSVAGLVGANMGFALIPHSTALDQPRVAFLHVSYPKCYRSIAVIWNKNRPLSPAAIKFKKFIIKFYTNYQ